VVKHALARTGIVFMDKAAVHQSFAVFKSVYEALCQQLAEGVLDRSGDLEQNSGKIRAIPILLV
jgi:hypothetical protein